ncbi:hypothetical protein FNH71_18640 [Salmonella enterica subsp. diarizonae]|nr:hypothetical protein [Salmonella enterica subsp. diarizonae]
MSGQQKKSLNTVIAGCYIFLAVTVLMVGRENPVIALAQTDAASVFFVALTFFAIERQIMARCVITDRVSLLASSKLVTHRATMSMVAQAGQSSDWPVSDATGILTPVWAIASERENSSDSMFAKRRRMPSWLRPQQKKHPKPAIPQLSYDCRRKIQRVKDFSFWLHLSFIDTTPMVAPHFVYAFSYIHDDIKAIDKELISLGLFDEAMGKDRENLTRNN